MTPEEIVLITKAIEKIGFVAFLMVVLFFAIKFIITLFDRLYSLSKDYLIKLIDQLNQLMTDLKKHMEDSKLDNTEIKKNLNDINLKIEKELLKKKTNNND